MTSYREDLEEVLRLLAARCPRLVQQCYWAGTSSIALEELSHRRSYDLDFHTRRALQDVRPLFAEIQQAFLGAFEAVQTPDAFGHGFSGDLVLSSNRRVAIEVLSNHEDVPERDLVASRLVPQLKRVTLARYLADKVQCVAERAEARDLVDIHATLRAHPELEQTARRILKDQDCLMLVERLMKWTRMSLEKDLSLYPEISVDDAEHARDMLLQWVKS